MLFVISNGDIHDDSQSVVIQDVNGKEQLEALMLKVATMRGVPLDEVVAQPLGEPIQPNELHMWGMECTYLNGPITK